MENQQEIMTYVVLLSAFEVVLNCSFELEQTKYSQGDKVKSKVKEAIHALSALNAKRRDKIWAIDPMLSADFMKGVQTICEQIAKGDGNALKLIAELTRSGIDFSKYELREI